MSLTIFFEIFRSAGAVPEADFHCYKYFAHPGQDFNHEEISLFTKDNSLLIKLV